MNKNNGQNYIEIKFYNNLNINRETSYNFKFLKHVLKWVERIASQKRQHCWVIGFVLS